jgi:hypothetical protein
MNAIIYPIHLRRNFQRRLAARFVSDDLHRSPPEGTDTCACGHTVVAPCRSTYAPNEVVNHWECSACGRRWETTAPCHGGIQ